MLCAEQVDALTSIHHLIHGDAPSQPEKPLDHPPSFTQDLNLKDFKLSSEEELNVDEGSSQMLFKQLQQLADRDTAIPATVNPTKSDQPASR